MLSKQLARSVQSGATLVFEDLTNILSRAKIRKTQHRCSVSEQESEEPQY